MFITTFTSAYHLSLSWASLIRSIPPHPTSWRSVLILSPHLRLALTSDLFQRDWVTGFSPLQGHRSLLLQKTSGWVPGKVLPLRVTRPVREDDHIFLLPRFRICEAIPLLPHGFVLLKHRDKFALPTGIWQLSWSMCGLLPYPEPVWNSVSPLGDNSIYRILYHHMNERDNKEAGLFIMTVYTWHTRRLYWTHNSISDIPSTIYITPLYCLFAEGSGISQVGIV